MANKKEEIKNNDHSYFYSLELEGINCFKDIQTLDLSDGNGSHSRWTIILGDNGTGKTTLLKVLDRIQPNNEEIDFTKFNRNLVENLNGYYFSRYFLEGINTDFKTHNIIYLTENNIKLNLSLIKNHQIKNVVVQGNIEKLEDLYTREFSNIFVLSYGASRRMSKSQNLRSSISRFSSSLFDDSIELINAEEWFLQKEWAVLKSENQTKVKFESEFNLVKEILLDILTDVEDIVSKTIDENNSKPKIEVKTPYGWVNIRDLSFGYQTLTALTVDIAASMMEQYPESKNPLSEPVIILIDEIDLHLHPKWQRTVIDKLSHHFPKAQFIVTAHSPLIVQAAEDKNANIVVCRKEGDRVVIDNNPDEVKGWRVDQILTSDLFELESPRSKVTQENVDEYINLKGKEKLTESDKKRIKILGPLVEKSYNQNTLNTTELDKKLHDFAEKFLK